MSQKLYETIEGYLRGSLVEKERFALEKELDDNPQLRAQFKEIEDIILGIESAALKHKMNDFHRDLPADVLNRPVRSLNRYINLRNIAIAASVALLFGISGFWYFSLQDSNQKLFNRHFIADPGLPTTMSATSDYQFYEAMVSYKQENFSDAIAQWEILLKQKPNNDTLNYFIGVAHLANSDAAKAIDYLKSASEVENSAFGNEALYYLGMAYLKEGNTAAAKKYLLQSRTERGRAVLSEIHN